MMGGECYCGHEAGRPDGGVLALIVLGALKSLQ
jgi:MYXO-CTERM domain-containing protein